MTIHITRRIECDACGKTVDIEDVGADGGFWYDVSSMVGTTEQLSQYAASERPTHDAGHFCSLICVANWASGRANLHDLDREGWDG